MNPLAALDEPSSYRELFCDPVFWTPYVREVCQKHRLFPGESVRMGVPGTCPTFITGERWVVKFFGALFNGGEAYAVEKEAARLLDGDPSLPIARVVASGELLEGAGEREDWPWPYLVFDFIPGVSIGEVREQLNSEDRLKIAREMGRITRRLHQVSLENSALFSTEHSPYRAFLERRREGCISNHRAWGTLPAHLVDQIDSFLPGIDALIDWSRPAHLIHADLTRDHLLGRLEGGEWQTLALIDFGDAMTGDFLYELVALSLDLFGGDRRMLVAFLDAYGISPAARACLPRKVLATALLHRFNVLGSLQKADVQVETLDELAVKVWGP